MPRIRENHIQIIASPNKEYQKCTNYKKEPNRRIKLKRPTPRQIITEL